MSKTLEQLLADSSFLRWMKDKSPTEEEKKWEAWLQENPEHQVLLREAKEIVMAVDSEYKIPDPERQLAILNQDIDQYERHQRRKNVIFTFSGDNQSYRNIGRYAAAAAILIAIMLGGVMGYYANDGGQASEQQIAEKPRIEEYRTDYGEKLTFRLSDGSRITLNGNSSLTFSSTVEKGLNTEVRLEGEAYFNIAHLEDEEQRTFTVQTDDGSIQVLGTRFAVNTFRDETKAVLEEGHISIRMDSTDTAGYRLAPGELAQFKANDNKIAVQEVNTRVYTSWKEDKLVFIKTPMREVATRIEDTFGVEVVLAENVADESLSGSIKSTNLDVLEKALEEILKTDIVQQDNKMVIGKDQPSNK